MRFFLWIILIVIADSASAGEPITVLEVEGQQGKIRGQFSLSGTTLTLNPEGQVQVTAVDRLQATLVVKSPESQAIQLPGFSGLTFGDFTLVEQGKTTRKRTTEIITTTSWLIEPYNKGEYDLPPLTITGTATDGTVTRLSLSLPTVEILDPDHPELPFDILPPRPIPTNPPWLMISGAIATTGLICLGVILLKRKRRPCIPSPKSNGLDGLEDLCGHNGEKSKELSLIIRQFLDGNFNLHTVGKTYKEYAPFLIKHPHISDAEPILMILNQCDQINYSGVTITDEEMTDLIQQTRTFIEESPEPLRPDEDSATCGRW